MEGANRRGVQMEYIDVVLIALALAAISFTAYTAHNTSDPEDKVSRGLIHLVFFNTIIALLATLATPSFLRARSNTQQNLCIEHLWELESTKDLWALENGIASGQAIADPTVLDIYIKGGTVSLFCPADNTQSFATSYQANVIGTGPVCLIDPANHTL